MSRLLLVSRLAARDLRRRPVEAVLLLLAITGAATVLTLGLVLHGVTKGPYENTREATAGPDVVASVVSEPSARERAERRPPGTPVDPAGLEALIDAPGIRLVAPEPGQGQHRSTMAPENPRSVPRRLRSACRVGRPH